jgi:hypothetical protein
VYSCGMERTEYRAGEPATSSGPYEELNVFGAPTGKAVIVLKGEAFPAVPRGFRWRPLAGGHSPSELRAQAARYRAIAVTATTKHALEGMAKLAEHFDTLADRREREMRGGT